MPDKNKGVGKLLGTITSLHEIKAMRNWRPCDPRRQHQLAAQLTGWLATATSPDPLHLTIVIPDETRPLAPERVLPSVLDAVAEASRRRGALIRATVLIATGLHRAPGAAFVQAVERALEPFARDPALEVTWHVHDPGEADKASKPLNPLVMSRRQGGGADRVVVVGLVEPHQYAGFSGGSKALSVGCGSTETIRSMHSLELLRQPGVQIGKVEGNPFRERLDQIAARHAAPTFTVALVPDPTEEGEIAGLFADASGRAFDAAVTMARRVLVVPLRRQFDFALLGVPESKAASLYQASRALTYLALHDSPCVKPGGTLVLMARCPEGFGQGRGERAFQEALGRGKDKLLAELAGKRKVVGPVDGGAQRAYVLARAMSRYRCALVGAGDLPEAAHAGLTLASDISALGLAGAGLIVDDPFVLMPYHDAREGAAFDRLVELSDRAPGGAA